MEHVWEQREAREKAEEQVAKQKKELELESKSAQDRLNHQSLELEKAWAMNADLVICVCCTLRHETGRVLLRNVALEQYLTPLILRLVLVPRKRNCRIHHKYSRSARGRLRRPNLRRRQVFMLLLID